MSSQGMLLASCCCGNQGGPGFLCADWAACLPQLAIVRGDFTYERTLYYDAKVREKEIVTLQFEGTVQRIVDPNFPNFPRMESINGGTWSYRRTFSAFQEPVGTFIETADYTNPQCAFDCDSNFLCLRSETNASGSFVSPTCPPQTLCSTISIQCTFPCISPFETPPAGAQAHTLASVVVGGIGSRVVERPNPDICLPDYAQEGDTDPQAPVSSGMGALSAVPGCVGSFLDYVPFTVALPGGCPCAPQRGLNCSTNPFDPCNPTPFLIPFRSYDDQSCITPTANMGFVCLFYDPFQPPGSEYTVLRDCPGSQYQYERFQFESNFTIEPIL